jgi:hypothetical protein
MAVLGLIIALVTGAFIVAAFLSASDPASLHVFGMTATTTVGRLVAVGALAGLLFMLGLVLLFGGMGRSARRRRETKQVVVSSRTEAEELRIENERLARELEQRQIDAYDANAAPAATVVTSGDIGTASRGEGYMPRHGDDTYNTPVAYPAEPDVAREDIQNR